MQKHVSQVLIYQNTCKNVQNCANTCKNVQKRASQIFWDPIQKRAPARSVQVETVYLEALLYMDQKAISAAEKTQFSITANQ